MRSRLAVLAAACAVAALAGCTHAKDGKAQPSASVSPSGSPSPSASWADPSEKPTLPGPGASAPGPDRGKELFPDESTSPTAAG